MDRSIGGVAIALLLAAVTSAGCGSPAPSRTASQIPSPSSKAGASSDPVSFDAGEDIAAITLGDFGGADGPGVSIVAALASGLSEPLLVNGSLLQEPGGAVWLCGAVLDTSPPACAQPRLAVRNLGPEDRTLVTSQGVRFVDGVRWLDQAQLFGVVSP